MESALVSMAEGAEGIDVEDCLRKLAQAMGDALETIRAALPQPGKSAQPQPAEGGNAPELDKTQMLEIARRVKQAAELGDVTEAMRAIELLPDGSEHRTRFTVMADDFDLDALVESAAELEQACAGRG